MKRFSVLFCALAMVAMACGGSHKAVPVLKEVSAVTAAKGTIEREVLFTGNIVAQSAYEVFPRATGKISKKLLREGDAVKKGQAILTIDRDEIGYKFRPLSVDSPTDGIVGTIFADVGANVGPEKAVATVVAPGDMKVKLDVPERYIEAIAPGTQVGMTVDSLGGKNFSGAIATKSPVVSEKTRTANVEVVLPNQDGILRHGMFGRMKLVVERHSDVIVAPNASISWEGDKQFVYKIGDGKVKRAQVKAGIRNDAHVEVLEGISEGDVLATGNLIELRDGESVVVKR